MLNAISCHASLCHIISRYHIALHDHVALCHIMALSCHVTSWPCLVTRRHVISCPALSCHIILGELSVATVTTAISHAAIHAHEHYNCLTEIFMSTALSQANKYDIIPPKSRHTMPLFGLPISIKDNVDIEGVDTTLGLTCNCNQPKTDAPLIKVGNE